MRYRILDIETVPHPNAQQWAEPVKPAGNLKDPEKIKADIAERQRKQADEFGLDPDCCRIVALGFHDVGYGDPAVYLMSDEFEEREQLKLFWASWKDVDRHSWQDGGSGAAMVTFNGLRFDLPVLMRRSMYLEVPHPWLSLDRYRTPHIDLWQKLSFNGAIDAHSLAFYAKRLGIGTLDKVAGSDIAKLAAEQRWQEIHDHCLSDIGLTHALANRMGLLKIGVAA